MSAYKLTVTGDPKQPGTFMLEIYSTKHDAESQAEILAAINEKDGRVYSVQEASA